MKKILITCFAAGLLFSLPAVGQDRDTTSTNSNMNQPVEAGDTIGTPDQSNRMHGQPGSFDNNSQDTTSTGQGSSQQGAQQSQGQQSTTTDTTGTSGIQSGGSTSSQQSQDQMNQGEGVSNGVNQDTTATGSSGSTGSMSSDTTGTSSSGTMNSGTTNSGSVNSTDTSSSNAVGSSSGMTSDSARVSKGTMNQGNAAGGSANEKNYGPQVEIVQGKEGPNNEVIYRINGEMFYVDREKREMVKIQEGDLKDADDEAVIHNSTNTSSTRRGR